MRITMRKLPLETQTLYSELLQQLLAAETHRSIGNLNGCFVTKTIKGKVYYYFQYLKPGNITQQIYVGKKTPGITRIVQQYQEQKSRFKPEEERIKMLCSQIRTGGGMAMDFPSYKVIRTLSEGGIFKSGGVLIGTHAFIVIGNILGVNWETFLRTQDIDIATEKNIDIILPQIKSDRPKTLEQLQMGFIPVPPLNNKNYSTSFKVRGGSLIVDVLTPGSANSTKPVFMPRFNTFAQPLPFLDFLVENYEYSAVISNAGILVNVPDPCRFAFHKLIICSGRSLVMHTKIEKDISQAMMIFAVICEERQGDVLLVFNEIKKRGTGWIKRIKRSLKISRIKFPSEFNKLVAIIPELSQP